MQRENSRTSWVCAPVSRHSITCHRLSLPVPVPVALWPRRQQAALVYEDTCSICSMLKLLNARFAQCSKPPKKCSKSPVPCKNSKFKNSKLRQSRNNSKFKNQQSTIKNHLITFSTSSLFLSNGPLCSSFSVHMAAANLPASVMLSPCERQ